MSPVVMAILVLGFYLVFYRFYAKGVLTHVFIRRERGNQAA